MAAPTIGSARVVRAVPALALAIGYDIDSALELMGDERLGDGECAGGA